MLHAFIYAAIGIGFLVLVDYLFSLRDDPREPPRLRPKLPLIGHLIGMVQYGIGRYCTQACQRSNSDMFTLGIFNIKIYVCNHRRIVPLVQRNAKTISLRPLFKLAAKKYSNADPHTYLEHSRELADKFGDMLSATLAPGKHLDHMNFRMGKQLSAELETFLDIPSGVTKTVKIYKWVEEAVVRATGYGVYGAHHPFVDHSIKDAFWTWQSYATKDIVGLSFFTNKGRLAREVVKEAFKKYNDTYFEDAAFVIHERHRILEEAGFTEDEVLDRDITFPVAQFANTIPTLFWAIWELFSRPQLVAEIRKEIETLAVTGSKEDGFVLDMAAVKSQCPLFLSVYQETQRTHHIHANTRAVTADTYLDNYLLKAKHYLLMPGQPIHSNTEIWGVSATEFDPYRFMPKEGTRRGVSTSHFLSWGAPPTLCPGRQFASTEILIALALLVVRSDLQPSRGSWTERPPLNYGEHAAVEGPRHDLDFDIKVRDQYLGSWSVSINESSSRISLASG